MRECYVERPDEVETYRVGKSTDVILRKSISEVTKTNEDSSAYTAYECDEVQYRYPGIVTKAAIEADMDTWWDWQPEDTATPSVEDDTDTMLVDHEYRLTLLELGIETE